MGFFGVKLILITYYIVLGTLHVTYMKKNIFGTLSRVYEDKTYYVKTVLASYFSLGIFYLYFLFHFASFKCPYIYIALFNQYVHAHG